MSLFYTVHPKIIYTASYNKYAMANRHIKVIKGRKYYYESIRKGKKVTSKYLGPVDEKTKTRKNAKKEIEEEMEYVESPEESYIG
jgi:hypothetical protein